MRLSSVEVIPYALPFREPYVTAQGRLEKREMVLLRLRTEEGLIGLGEAVPLSLRGGVTIDRVVEELEQLAEIARSGASMPDEVGLLGGALGLSAPARCAALVALMDLRSRHAEEGSSPGREPQPVTCNATLIAGRPGAVAEDALRWAEQGFSTFKLKLGAGDDVAQVRAVREALGAGALIRVDANAAWDVETAKRTLTEIEPFSIELAEQPAGTLGELAEVSLETSIPIAADESVTNVDEAGRAARIGACAYTGVKLSKVGGPESALAIADVLPSYMSSAIDGPVGIAAAAHMARTLGEAGVEIAHGLATQRLFASTVASVECELRGEMLHLPAGPGLGVEIDEDALRAHRL